MNRRVLGSCFAIVTCLCVSGLMAVYISFIASTPQSTVMVTTCIFAIVFNALICGVAVWKRDAVARSSLAIPKVRRKTLLLVCVMSIIGSFTGGILVNFPMMFLSMSLIPFAFHYLLGTSRRTSESNEADDATSR